MGIVEQSLGQTSGLRNVVLPIHVITNSAWMSQFTTAQTPGTKVLRAAFTNKFVPQARTASIVIINTGGSTSVFTATFFGISMFGRAVRETITATQVGAGTEIQNGKKVFADIGSYTIDAHTFVAADTIQVGFNFVAADTLFGIPYKIVRKEDIVYGHESSAFATQAGIDLSALVFDAGENAIKLPSTVAANDLVILGIRTTLD